MKLLKLGLLILTAVVSLVILINVLTLCEFVTSGKMLMGDNVTFSLGDMSWGNLPIQLREEISKQSIGTKVDDKDLKELIVYYTKLYNEYQEPFSLKEK